MKGLVAALSCETSELRYEKQWIEMVAENGAWKVSLLLRDDFDELLTAVDNAEAPLHVLHLGGPTRKVGRCGTEDLFPGGASCEDLCDLVKEDNCAHLRSDNGCVIVHASRSEGVGRVLSQWGVTNVICWRGTTTDRACEVFDEGFYPALASNKRIADCITRGKLKLRRGLQRDDKIMVCDSRNRVRGKPVAAEARTGTLLQYTCNEEGSRLEEFEIGEVQLQEFQAMDYVAMLQCACKDLMWKFDPEPNHRESHRQCIKKLAPFLRPQVSEDRAISALRESFIAAW